jgi:hypothetical protein
MTAEPYRDTELWLANGKAVALADHLYYVLDRLRSIEQSHRANLELLALSERIIEHQRMTIGFQMDRERDLVAKVAQLEAQLLALVSAEGGAAPQHIPPAVRVGASAIS